MAIASYEKIRADLARRIEVGEVAVGDRLPSERDLAASYGVSLMTARHAVAELVDSGVIVKRWGVGNFVASSRAVRRPLNELRSFTEDMAADGHTTRTKVLCNQDTVPPDEIRQALGASAAGTVVKLERLRLLDDRPVALQRSWLPRAAIGDLTLEPLVQGSLYLTLRRGGITLARAEQLVTAVSAKRAQAEPLGVRTHSPLLHTERTTFNEAGVVAEYAQSWTVSVLPLAMTLHSFP